MTQVRAAVLAGLAVLLAGLLLVSRPSVSVGGSADEHLTDENTCGSGCDSLYQICCLSSGS